jgi:hypothetical protein
MKPEEVAFSPDFLTEELGAAGAISKRVREMGRSAARSARSNGGKEFATLWV